MEVVHLLAISVIGLFPLGGPPWWNLRVLYKIERNTRSMAGGGRYGQKSRGACLFLQDISKLAGHVLAPGWLVRGGHLDDELWLLAWQVEAAAADERLAKRHHFTGEGVHVVFRLAADACRVPSLAGFWMPP